MKNYIYIHVCCINNWKEIFNKLVADIKKSGLYDNIDEIRCVFLTRNSKDADYIKDPKIKIKVLSDYGLYEVPTINMIHQDAQKEDFNVLYIHTKGVSVRNQNNPFVKDWVEYLIYFNIYLFQTCIDKLSMFDAVGVNLQNEPTLHFSGNFWWSKSEHIKKLNPCEAAYWSPEFWIAYRKKGKYLSLWNSNINHYVTRYPSYEYIDAFKNKNDL